MLIACLKFFIWLNFPLLLEGVSSTADLIEHAQIVEQLGHINISDLIANIVFHKLGNVYQIAGLGFEFTLQLHLHLILWVGYILDQFGERVTGFEQSCEIGEKHNFMIAQQCQSTDDLIKIVLVHIEETIVRDEYDMRTELPDLFVDHILEQERYFC